MFIYKLLFKDNIFFLITSGYIIEKKPFVGKISRWTKVVTLDATVLKHIIENLKESEFVFRVYAENSLGLSLPALSEPILLKSHARKFSLLQQS